MPSHPFHKIDQEDRKHAHDEALAEARWQWFTIGAAVTLGVISALVHTGVIR